MLLLFHENHESSQINQLYFQQYEYETCFATVCIPAVATSLKLRRKVAATPGEALLMRVPSPPS